MKLTMDRFKTQLINYLKLRRTSFYKARQIVFFRSLKDQRNQERVQILKTSFLLFFFLLLLLHSSEKLPSSLQRGIKREFCDPSPSCEYKTASLNHGIGEHAIKFALNGDGHFPVCLFTLQITSVPFRGLYLSPHQPDISAVSRIVSAWPVEAEERLANRGIPRSSEVLIHQPAEIGVGRAAELHRLQLS